VEKGVVREHQLLKEKVQTLPFLSKEEEQKKGGKK
jgi:hypothetical protein